MPQPLRQAQVQGKPEWTASLGAQEMVKAIVAEMPSRVAVTMSEATGRSGIICQGLSSNSVRI